MVLAELTSRWSHVAGGRHAPVPSGVGRHSPKGTDSFESSDGLAGQGCSSLSRTKTNRMSQESTPVWGWSPTRRGTVIG